MPFEMAAEKIMSKIVSAVSHLWRFSSDVDTIVQQSLSFLHQVYAKYEFQIISKITEYSYAILEGQWIFAFWKGHQGIPKEWTKENYDPM